MSLTSASSVQLLKEAAKRCIPDVLLNARRAFLLAKLRKKFTGLSVNEAFTAIYTDGLWGGSGEPGDFCSGNGSRQPVIISAYVTAVQVFLKSFDTKPNVVDLGCGDFHLGSRIRAYCGRYIACDIVEPLIERNKVKFRGLEVDFRLVDMTKDELPDGDVVFIRQVFQHLSNDLISATMPKLSRSYKYLVLTEHVPSLPSFIPNLDKVTGPDTRLTNASGVVLTSPPFNLEVRRAEVLCEAFDSDGAIRTHLYELR
jgi:hypothetical protein